LGLTEKELVQQLLQERARLVAYIWSIVRDAHLAEDVFQEVSLLAVSKRGEIEHIAAFPTWLRKAARLHALEGMRKAGRAGSVLGNEVLDALDRAWEEKQADSVAERSAALQHCLERLTPRSRQIVALRYHGKLSGQEVARKMKVEAHSLYVALGRIHKTLRDCMQRALGDERVSYE
jgi:RNA polymerase sigma-70 factor (ECF subfamily)